MKGRDFATALLWLSSIIAVASAMAVHEVAEKDLLPCPFELGWVDAGRKCFYKNSRWLDFVSINMHI